MTLRQRNSLRQGLKTDEVVANCWFGRGGPNSRIVVCFAALPSPPPELQRSSLLLPLVPPPRPHSPHEAQSAWGAAAERTTAAAAVDSSSSSGGRSSSSSGGDGWQCCSPQPGGEWVALPQSPTPTRPQHRVALMSDPPHTLTSTRALFCSAHSCSCSRSRLSCQASTWLAWRSSSGMAGHIASW